MDLTFGIRRAGWRQTFRPAPEPPTEGLRLVAPEGVVAEHVEAATRPLHRARGLLGRTPLREGSALLLAPCTQIHTFGMRYPIDVVFCDAELRVLSAVTLPPSRMSRPVFRAWCCFELPAGTVGRVGLRPGVWLRLERGAPAPP